MATATGTATAELGTAFSQANATSDAQDIHAATRARTRKRRRIVRACQLSLLVLIVGGWEVASRTHLIDPFFFGEPSRVWSQLIDWFKHGTQAGSIWQQMGYKVRYWDGPAASLPG